MENQNEQVVDPKTAEFIAEQKNHILGIMKAQGLDKEAAEQFLETMRGMLTTAMGIEMGVTPEMQVALEKEWPIIKEEILKGY